MSSSISSYKQSTVENAPPLKIVQMMYEGALRFLKQAETIDPSTERTEFNSKLYRALGIVTELRVSLVDSHTPAVANNLRSLYLFAEERINKSIVSSDKAPIEEARVVLQPLLEAWKNVALEEA